MLSRHRRYFAVLSFVLLATPLAVGIASPDDPKLILKEGRRPAPAPGAPESWDAYLGLPRQLDAYLRDRFGLRQKMIRLDKDLTKPLLPQSNEMVLVGQEGRMFLLGGETVLQSAGRVLRRDKVVAAADMLAAMHQALERRGIRLVVALPPNASTIYQEELPGWARNPGRQTEYDLLLELLTARGVKAVDLRPALRAARKNGPTYFKYDTHWTARGALAGFNSIVEADAHPEWRIDPESGALAMANRKGGDLARMYGVEDRVEENVEELTLPSGTTEELTSPPYPTYVQASNAAGPTIMVIGDSFTEFQFARMLRSHAGRVVWLYYNRCEFDWTWVDRFHPDEVWWAPTERFLICDAGAHPTDFAG